MTKKTLLITGAAGFIGFHTALELKAQGHTVIGLDNFNAYYSVELKNKRAQHLRDKGIEIVSLDLNDRLELGQLFEKHPFTHVLNLAAQAGVRYARENPEAYIASNIEGFLSLLETLRHFSHIKLVYASSSSVYGRNTKIPFAVSDRTDKPANLYAATKKANELMAYTYQHLYGISSVGLRFFTVYGPWGRPDMAYYSFTKAILEGQPLHLFNQGKMQRDFTYIADVVQGIVAALDYQTEYALFNLGNHQPVPLLEFVAILEKLLHKKAEIVLKGASAGEVETTFADIEETQRALGYNPVTDLETGLKHFVEWYKRHPS